MNNMTALPKNSVSSNRATIVGAWGPSTSNDIRSNPQLDTKDFGELRLQDRPNHDDSVDNTHANQPPTLPQQQPVLEHYDPMHQWLNQSPKEDPWTQLREPSQSSNQKSQFVARKTHFHPKRS
ncbi:hypothetical protein TWF481_007692 [Arthrobotrys musiformis]|uniref:Uncharacterized protein n=1 Tax=Arthrobotrys musiformis TaxID=47236 RepID=A0AAV9WCA7_9PEZI